ncbi:MAG TPA: GNAT family N-acetyltransferase [Mycobacteriales bacterium]|nr:GNAT family N-acetyltransferase [Mycobacteriales bacterium]
MAEITGPGPLLDTAYDEILAASFPGDELMTAEDLRDDLAAGSLGAAILDDHGRPLAVAIGTWSASSDVLLLSYLAVRPGYRGAGLGGALLARSRDVWLPRVGGCALLAEVEHPAAHPASEAYGDPVARLRFYARHGGRALDLPYFQPALAPGRHRVYGLVLVALALTSTGAGRRVGTVAPEPVRRLLTRYFTATEGAVGDDPASTALWRCLDRPEGVPLLPLDDPAALPLSQPDPHPSSAGPGW